MDCRGCILVAFVLCFYHSIYDVLCFVPFVFAFYMLQTTH